MFFRVLCPLTDRVWKLSPDKSKSLPQMSCCVVQFQTPAAASRLVAAGGACSLSVGGAVLPSSAVSLGLNSHVGPLLTLPHLSHQFLHVSLCALH